MYPDRDREYPLRNNWIIFQLSRIKEGTDKLKDVRGSDNEKSGNRHRRAALWKWKGSCSVLPRQPVLPGKNEFGP
jgi:hypothetical protein